MEWLLRLNQEQRTRFESLLASNRELEAMRLLRDDGGVDQAVAEAYVCGRADERTGRLSAPAHSWIPADVRDVRSDAAAAAERADGFLRAGQKIQAIREYREITGASLTDAKRAVEARAAELPVGEQGVPANRNSGGCLVAFFAIATFSGITAIVLHVLGGH